VRVLVSGGGTAGHIYPALTVAEHVRSEEHSEVAFVGAPDSLEARLASEAGLEFIGIEAKGWDRAAPLSFLLAAATTAVSFFRCLVLLRKSKTDVVVGFGGYVSLPLGLAAALGGVPLVLHEQNSIPGLANRVLSRWATVACVTYASSIPRLAHPARALVTGDPVRPSVLSADAVAGRRALNLRKNETVLLVFGGSRGARHLNQAMVELYPKLDGIAKLQVVHIAGPTEAAAVREALAKIAGGKLPGWWQVLEYTDRMGDAIAAADAVVCRAGATTLAELAAIGRPALLVPYPYATDDHQSYNAIPFVEAGAAVAVSDSGLDSPAFGDEVLRLLKDVPRRDVMAAAAVRLGRPYAAAAVADAALEAGLAGSPWRLKERREAAATHPLPKTAEDAVPTQPDSKGAADATASSEKEETAVVAEAPASPEVSDS
jgi:UDP-N-acetylglucosamine--N-acetylmuramyl-(pentapeptide) pyrophosphoryl-undecaprenol N-acetylglucosamine transferase